MLSNTSSDITDLKKVSKKSVIEPKMSRGWGLISYLSESQLKQVIDLLVDKGLVIHWLYVLHDKDLNDDGSLKQAHYHLWLNLSQSRTCNCVRHWFYGFTDSDGELVNTLATPWTDYCGAVSYATHENFPERYQYTIDDIVCDDFAWWYDVNNSHSADTLTQALEDILSGIPISDCIKVYGRDFIIHYGSIRAILYDMGYFNH